MSTDCLKIDASGDLIVIFKQLDKYAYRIFPHGKTGKGFASREEVLLHLVMHYRRQAIIKDSQQFKQHPRINEQELSISRV